MASEARLKKSGTRFRLFPQAPVMPAFAEPEIVEVSPAPGSVGPGPSDDRMYVVDAVEKPRPYEFPYLPPFAGRFHPPVMPGPDGHFDHLDVGTRKFNAAHMYGALRFVLDIWEDYFGRRIEWHFAEHYARIELIPHLDWDNAQSGYGFIETGFGYDEDYGEHPFCLNFDILAHELGHSLVYAVVGAPSGQSVSAAYLGFQEAASDIITLISTLHFHSVVNHVLTRTRGNLYAPNLLDRFAELSPTTQIRSAGNSLRMSAVPDLRTPASALTHPERHLIAQPLTGAVFDLLVELFQGILVAQGLIGEELDALSRRVEEGAGDSDEARIQEMFDETFETRREEFARALVDARDVVGELTAAAFARLQPGLAYADVAAAYLQADRRLTGGALGQLIYECFDWREIFTVAGKSGGWSPGLFPKTSLVTRNVKMPEDSIR